MTPERVVITGGPGSGKTSIIDALERDGYTCFHEIIRTFTQEVKDAQHKADNKNNPIAFVDDALEFNRKLLEGRLNQFHESAALDDSIVFFDRGMPDVLAYMDFFKQEYPDDFRVICTENRYDRIVILPPWKEIYSTDNERLENWDVAYEIYDFLKGTYSSLGYKVEDIPIGSIETRKKYLENLVNDKI